VKTEPITPASWQATRAIINLSALGIFMTTPPLMIAPGY
jgi:hypothetical protein